MTPSLQPYPGYKHSGIPWLGDLPEHWEVRRGGWIFRKMDRPVRDVDEVVTCFRDGTVTLRKNRRTEGFTESLQEIGYQGVRKGDLVIHQMDAFAGAIGVSDSDGKGTPVYSVCYPTQHANPFYYALIVREMARSQWILALAKGIRERSTDFRYSEFSNQTLPLPPLFEQQAIVKYLNHADRRIRRYVTAKQKLIALLEEEKQAVVSRAVTRGLDPNVRLKPSGVAWLGDVPEHWGRCRLRNVVSVVTTGSRGWSSYASDTGPLFIRVANLNRGSLQLRFDDTVRLNLPETSEVTRTRIRAGDLLVSVTAYIGSVGLAPEEFEEAYVSQHVARCQPLPGSSSRWLGYVLLSTVGQTHGQISLYGGTKDGLSLDDVKNYQILLPPLDEQIAIVEHLDKTSADIDAAIARVRRQIELLQEYRTSLIADVVTGKLDVREAAAQLVDETDDQDPIEGDGPLTDGMDKDLYDADASGEELAMESEVTV